MGVYLTSTFKTWLKAVARPAETTYLQLAGRKDATRLHAYFWMASSGFFSGIFAFLWYWGTDGLSGYSLFIIGFYLLFGSIVPIIRLIAVATIMHPVARLFGGEGMFDNFVFALSGFGAPLNLILDVINLSKIGSFFAFIVLTYIGTLVFIATKAVHKISWLKTLIVTIISYSIIAVLALGSLVSAP